MVKKQLKKLDTDLLPDVARKLTAQAFKLRKQLGYSMDQMAQEAGMKVKQLSRLRSVWVTGTIKQPKLMKMRFANGLLKFWFLHLDESPLSSESNVKKAQNLSVNSSLILSILVDRCGVEETLKLLKARKREDLFEKYLYEISLERLADLAVS